MTDKIVHMRANIDVAPISGDVMLEPYTFGSFTFTTTGLVVKGTPDMDEWAAVGHMLAVQVQGLQFMTGDWLLYGERHYGELAAQVIDARNWSDETVRVYRWVAEKVPKDCRREDLTFTHHFVVAGLKPDDQKKWLKKAATSEEAPWPASRLKSAVKHGTDAGVLKWYVLVEARSKVKRDELQKELELRGLSCRAIDKRGPQAQ